MSADALRTTALRPRASSIAARAPREAAASRGPGVATVLAMLAVALLIVLALQVGVVRPALEGRLGDDGSSALTGAGLGGVQVSVEGRTAVLTGSVPDDAARAAAIEAVQGVDGVRTVDAEGLTVLARSAPAAPPAAAAPAPALAAPGAVPAPPEVAGAQVAPAAPPAGTDAPLSGGGLLAGLPALSFVAGEAGLTPESMPTVVALAQRVNGAPDGQNFVIRTHTDSEGDAVYNQWLSEMRAMELCEQLVASGVDQARLSIVGVGETEPLVSPEVTDADRAANRRIEVVPAD